ncbi:unnamed protein product [Choristocarpus tenellus]
MPSLLPFPLTKVVFALEIGQGRPRVRRMWLSFAEPPKTHVSLDGMTGMDLANLPLLRKHLRNLVIRCLMPLTEPRSIVVNLPPAGQGTGSSLTVTEEGTVVPMRPMGKALESQVEPLLVGAGEHDYSNVRALSGIVGEVAVTAEEGEGKTEVLGELVEGSEAVGASGMVVNGDVLGAEENVKGEEDALLEEGSTVHGGGDPEVYEEGVEECTKEHIGVEGSGDGVPKLERRRRWRWPRVGWGFGGKSQDLEEGLREEWEQAIMKLLTLSRPPSLPQGSSPPC